MLLTKVVTQIGQLWNEKSLPSVAFKRSDRNFFQREGCITEIHQWIESDMNIGHGHSYWRSVDIQCSSSMGRACILEMIQPEGTWWIYNINECVNLEKSNFL